MRLMFALFAIAAIAGCVSVDVTEAERSQLRQSIVPPDQQQLYDDLHFSPAMRAGDYIFVSGVVAGMRPTENGDTAMEQSFDRAFRGVSSVLEAAGADWGDVVEITTYHTDLPAQFQLFSRVKDRHVGEPYPAWTAIDVDRLLPDNGIVEIRVIAYAPRD
jgi:enamine deaminase RidA (YjgF/YER057c/UK114 family)